MRNALADALAFLERPEIGWVEGVGGRRGRRSDGQRSETLERSDSERLERPKTSERLGRAEGWSTEVGGLGGWRGGRGLCRVPNDVRRMACAA
jgi:hypothetical protein